MLGLFVTRGMIEDRQACSKMIRAPRRARDAILIAFENLLALFSLEKSMEPLIQTIFENQDLLVLHKPAGLVCHPTKGDAYSSLISRLRLYSQGAFQPQLVNRLDRETSGVMLIAKNPKAASELKGIFESRKVLKRYESIVHGWVEPDTGMIEAKLGPDKDSGVAIKDWVCSDGAASRTEYRVLKRFTREEGNFSHLEVIPHTGRKHQIRIHLAYLRHPIVGDKIYGGDEAVYLSFVANAMTHEQKMKMILPYQALHSMSLEFNWNKESHHYRSGAEEWFSNFLLGDEV